MDLLKLISVDDYEELKRLAEIGRALEEAFSQAACLEIFERRERMQEITLGSLFDGIGGFPLAAQNCGIETLWTSEIEPNCINITKRHFPNMEHLGNITEIDGSKIAPVDIISFGSPCQDLSVAGKREGIDGERSRLFREAIRIIYEMREATNGKYPKFAIWENVPGAFSSNKGEDFRTVLEEITKTEIPMPRSGKWATAGMVRTSRGGTNVVWRQLDAQYWGVPQRRKRIFLVADFTGRCAEEILFKSESLSGYSKESFRTWQGTADCFEKGIRETGTSSVILNDQGGNRMDITEDVTCTLRAEAHHPPCVMDVAVFDNHGKDTRFTGPIDVAPTISATYGTGGNNQPFVVSDTPKTLKIRSGREGGGKGTLIQNNKSATLSCNNDQTLFVPKAYGICSKDSNAMKSSNPNSGIYEADTSRTIDGNGGNPACNQGGIAIVETYTLQGSMIGRKDKNGPQGDGVNEEVSFTLNTVDKHGVVYAIDRESFNCGQNYARNLGITEDGISSTLNAQGPGAVATPTYSSTEELANTLVATDYKEPPIINGNDGIEYTVRRLTPLECERLQGFPDNWTESGETGEIVSDTQRYKAIGNSIAVPCAERVFKGIIQVIIKQRRVS